MNDGRFKPGNNANPTGSDGGKKRLNKQLADKLAHCVPSAVKLIEKALKSSQFEEWKWGTDTVLNRVYGKAPESLEITGADGGPIAVMSDMPLTAEEFMLKYAPKADE
jgi:hypothetical protein